MGMCKGFFKDATKIQNGRQKSTLKNLLGEKLLNSKSDIIQNTIMAFHSILDMYALMIFKLVFIGLLLFHIGRQVFQVL